MSATVSQFCDTPIGSHLVSTMTLNDNKAGMEGLDKEKINQIIYEASKGSKFFENEQKKEEKLNQRIKEQENLISSLSPAQLLQGLKEADELIVKLEENRDLTHTFVHVDMDAFYAAVEMRDDPSLRDKPMAVGGMGMLATSNYIARRYGVRAAMPGFIGLKLCPNLVLVKPNFKKYAAVSLEIREIFTQYDPNFQPMSLDEAYLDLTEHLNRRSLSLHTSRLFLIRPKSDKGWILLNNSDCLCDLNTVLRPSIINSKKLNLNIASLEDMQTYLNSLDISGLGLPRVCMACNKRYPTFSLKLYGISSEDAVMEMRNRIEQRTFLTASAGIAPNTMLAKVCSDINKPNGQFRILPDLKEIEEFMKNLPIRKISGIGKVTEKLLGSLSINLCTDLYTQRAILYHIFSSISFQYFMRIMLGIGSTSLERDEERKSISTEQTFAEINEPSQLYDKCSELCQLLVEDLNKEQLMGKTVSLKIKTVCFEVKTHSHTLQNYTSDEKIIFNAAKHLLKTEIDAVKPNVLRLRLMGVRLSKFMIHRSQASIVKMFSDTTKDLSNTISKTTGTIGVTFPNIDPLGKTCVTEVYNNEDSRLSEDSCDDAKFWESLEVGETSIQKNVPSSKKSNEKSTAKKTISKKVNLSESKVKNSMLKFVCNTKNNMCNDTTNSDCSFDTSTVKGEIEVIDDKFRYNNSISCSSLINSELLVNFSHQHLNRASAKIHLPKSEAITCPVCGQQKSDWPLDQLNKHMDLCLSRKTIKSILQDDHNNELLKNPKRILHSSDDSTTHSEPKKKKTQQTVTDYFK